MKKIKHSKIKNTGLLFELLVRQVAVDTMNNRNSMSLSILNKFFKGSSELSKELKLYHSLNEETFTTESKALKFIDAVVSARKTLNEAQLKREKYNLIKEIKNRFNLEEFFKSRVTNYKLHASIYNIFEHSEADEPGAYVRNKFRISEHVQSKKNKNEAKPSLMSEDKDLRILASKIVIDKFNEKYSKTLSVKQKSILREFINNVTNSEKLKKYVITETRNIQRELADLKPSIASKVIRIKINEVTKLLSQLQKKHIVEDKDVLTMLRYYELINEIKKCKDVK
jgi:hypothetical protein